MKKSRWIFPIMMGLLSMPVSAQKEVDLSIGGGYFGESIFHPGVMAQIERDHKLTRRLSIPVRFDLGYYMHKQSHQAIFADLASGIRIHLGRNERGYVGVGAALGGMSTWYHSDSGVYEVGDGGEVTQTTNFAGVFFSPAAHLEFGCAVTKDKSNSIWFRPKFMAQLGVNEKSLWHYAFEVGYSYTFKKRNK